MLGDISCITYSKNPMVNKSDVMWSVTFTLSSPRSYVFEFSGFPPRQKNQHLQIPCPPGWRGWCGLLSKECDLFIYLQHFYHIGLDQDVPPIRSRFTSAYKWLLNFPSPALGQEIKHSDWLIWLSGLPFYLHQLYSGQSSPWASWQPASLVEWPGFDRKVTAILPSK